MTTRSMARRSVLALLLVGVPALAGASMLHLKLSRSEPAANAVLTASPQQVKLWFTQKPELTVTSIKVTSGTGATAVERTLAPLTRANAADAPITVPVGAPLAAGHYQIVWRTMARDGHVLNGVIPFDVRDAR
jgi:methionine-rich copper-binding protein CopC